MVEEKDTNSNFLPPVSNTEAVIGAFKQALASGKHWYPALLEAIGLWTDDEEVRNQRTYRYLVAREAFDWLLLAERLCEAVEGLVPEKEKHDLLFHSKPPLNLTADEFKKLIGHTKYRQFLNYFYGITVEETLMLAVCEEVRKERLASGLIHRYNEEEEAYRRIYDEDEVSLLKQFRMLHNYPQSSVLKQDELKEFTYWRFKRRLKITEKARVASDTQKALDWLRRNNYHGKMLFKMEPY